MKGIFRDLGFCFVFECVGHFDINTIIFFVGSITYFFYPVNILCPVLICNEEQTIALPTQIPIECYYIAKDSNILVLFIVILQTRKLRDASMAVGGPAKKLH